MKHSAKRRKCWLPAFWLLHRIVSITFSFTVTKSRDCVSKGWNSCIKPSTVISDQISSHLPLVFILHHRLAEKGSIVSDKDYLSTKYVRDCIKEQKFLDMDEYRLVYRLKLSVSQNCKFRNLWHVWIIVCKVFIFVFVVFINLKSMITWNLILKYQTTSARE